MDSTADVPLTPPASPFFGDGITVEAVGQSGGVTFTASGVNSANVVTELLLQPLKSGAVTPQKRAYRSAGFVHFGGSRRVETVFVAGLWVAVAVRYVNSLTGQQSPLLELGVVQMGQNAGTAPETPPPPAMETPSAADIALPAAGKPSALDECTLMLSNDDVLTIFQDSGALLSGHFLLASGFHSAQYLEKFQVLQFPQQVETLCKEIARRFAGDEIQVVVGPTTGGVLLAYEVAKQLGVRGIFAERGDDGRGRVLRRGFELREGERVLLVDDILTTGGSVRDTMQAIEGFGATLVGVGVLADRSGGTLDFGVPLEALLTLDIPKFAPDNIPEWLAAVPLTERGTTRHGATT